MGKYSRTQESMAVIHAHNTVIALGKNLSTHFRKKSSLEYIVFEEIFLFFFLLCKHMELTSNTTYVGKGIKPDICLIWYRCMLPIKKMWVGSCIHDDTERYQEKINSIKYMSKFHMRTPYVSKLHSSTLEIR